MSYVTSMSCAFCDQYHLKAVDPNEPSAGFVCDSCGARVRSVDWHQPRVVFEDNHDITGNGRQQTHGKTALERAVDSHRPAR